MFGEPDREVLQMEASSDSQTQIEKKEQLLKLTYRMEGSACKKAQTANTPTEDNVEEDGKTHVDQNG